MQFEFGEINFNCGLIHSELVAQGELVCFMCDHKLIQLTDIKNLIDANSANNEICNNCNNPSLIRFDEMIVCNECGCVDDYLMVLDVEMYGNCQIRKKSIYQSKYYIQNIINHISKKHHIQVPVRIRVLICKVIDLIRSSKEIMRDRRRIISIKYIIREIFKLTELPYDFMPQSKSKITRRTYKAFWDIAMKSSIGNIINKTIYV